MKKFLLVVFIILDLAAMAGASVFLYMYVDKKRHLAPKTVLGGGRAVTGIAPVAPTLATNVKTPTASSTTAPIPPTVPAMTNSPYRNIGFTYKNVKARQVLIRADFTGWKGVPMKRDASGLWSFSAQLVPGEYAYCFTVDDKIIKDPANRHTKRIAQTQVSSITVEKAPVKVEP